MKTASTQTFCPSRFIGRADDSTYEQTSHELRFSGSVGDNFDWVGGANYVDSEQKIDRVVALMALLDRLQQSLLP